MTVGVRVEQHPPLAGVVVALGWSTVAVAAVAGDQLVALAVELVALVVAVVGVRRLRDGDPFVGVTLGGIGVLGVLAAFWYGAAAATRTTQLVELLPGMVGVGLLALGGLPIRSRWSRTLVASGAVTVGLGVVASGVVHGAGPLNLFVATALAVIAWDAAEQAVNLGEQVGPRATSGTVVLAHSVWSVGVGAVGVVAAVGVSDLDVTGVPLLGVGLLLVAAVALATAAFT